MNKERIIAIDVDNLIEAKWNYKEDDELKLEKLIASIKEDNSAGIPAVRELSKGKYEVIDGNHRLKAIRKLGWKTAICENFGDISKAKAILVARRRNTLWFDDNVIKLSKLFKDEVLKEYTAEQLASIMPESLEEINNLTNLVDFDWSQYDKNEEGTLDSWKTFKVLLTEDQMKVVMQALNNIIKEEGYTNNAQGMALEMICADYLSK